MTGSVKGGSPKSPGSHRAISRGSKQGKGNRISAKRRSYSKSKVKGSSATVAVTNVHKIRTSQRRSASKSKFGKPRSSKNLNVGALDSSDEDSQS